MSVHDFLRYKEIHGDKSVIMERLEQYMQSNFKNFKSLFNFRDLEHTNQPLYKNHSFLVYEKNHLRDARESMYEDYDALVHGESSKKTNDKKY